MKNVIISGAGEVGIHTAEVLYRQGHSITVIDTDPEALKKIESTIEARLILGSACDADILKDAHIDSCDVMIAATSLDEINFMSSTIGKQMGAKKVIARVHRRTFYQNKHINYGKTFAVDSMICPEELTSKAICSLLYDPDVIAVHRFAQNQIELHQFLVKPQTTVFHNPLAKISFPAGVRVIIVRRDQQSIIPDRDTVLARDDLVTVVMPTSAIDTVRSMFNYQKYTRQSIALAGGSPIAEWVLGEIDLNRFAVRMFESNLDNAETLAAKFPAVTVLNADPVEGHIFDSEHLEQLAAYVATGPNQEHNILGALQAKSKGVKRTFAIINNSTYLSSLSGIGIDHAFSPRIEAAKELLRLLDESPVKILGKVETGDVCIFELTVRPKSAGVGQTLRQLNFPRATIIAAIQRDQKVIAPTPEDDIRAHDVLVIIGPSDTEKSMLSLFIKE